jgi:hypothetical protein
MTKFKTVRNSILVASLLTLSTAAFAGVFVSVAVAPPVLPVYAQPICPGDGYIWTPGYWAYGPAGYYWVPGAWVVPPRVGFLWTPGYWGFGGGVYAWHAGYWGPHVGFYGGVNYGFGYSGVGFVGGMWVGSHFSYNTAVTNVNTTIVHNTYVNKTVINNTTVNRASFNGAGGVSAQPTAAERQATREEHLSATSAQSLHEHSAAVTHAQARATNVNPNHQSVQGGHRTPPAPRTNAVHPQSRPVSGHAPLAGGQSHTPRA